MRQHRNKETDNEVLKEKINVFTVQTKEAKSNNGSRDYLPHLNVGSDKASDDAQKLVKLLRDFDDVIALPGDDLGFTDLIEHGIPLIPGARPSFVPAYRIPHKQRAEVDTAVDEMMKQGVIESSNSPWNSPIFLVLV